MDATIKRIDSPNCRLDTILDIVKGPDFPTGGLVLGNKGIIDAFTTGRGKVVVRSKVEIEKEKNRNLIVVTEIPYDIVKVNIVKKIDEIRIDKKIDGITEVRDESDKDGLRIVIETKKDANTDLILNYLYKNSELQTTYNYNMVAIVNRRPKLLSILEILDAYIAHFKEVITNRTEFDLAHAKARYHIVEGLIKAISILDDVIKTIRRSKNKSDAEDNLVKEFGFTKEQATAIVTLQLYRLSNTDIELLENELKNLNIIINALTKILSDEEELKRVMKDELRNIKKEYDTPRKTVITEEEAEIKIDMEAMIPKEDVIVLVTKDGYVKRTSKRSYNANPEEPLLKEGDYTIGLFEQNTLDTLLLFTNLGNYLYLPVHEIPDIKWKMLGKHISNIIKIEESEQIISAIPINDFDKKLDIVIASKGGMIKKTLLNEFKVSRYSKPISCMKLKDSDEVVNAFIGNYNDIYVSTNSGYGLWFDINEVPESGIKSSGVKSINLKGDFVVSAFNFSKDDEYLTVFTDKGTAKRIKLLEIEKQSRAKRGIMILREVKSNPHNVIKTFITRNKSNFGIKTEGKIEYIKSAIIPISDRYKTGAGLTKDKVLDVFELQNISKEEDIKEEVIVENEIKEVKKEPKQISLLEIDDELSKIDNILF